MRTNFIAKKCPLTYIYGGMAGYTYNGEEYYCIAFSGNHDQIFLSTRNNDLLKGLPDDYEIIEVPDYNSNFIPRTLKMKELRDRIKRERGPTFKLW